MADGGGRIYGLMAKTCTIASHASRKAAIIVVVRAAPANRRALVALPIDAATRWSVKCGVLLMEQCPIIMRVVKSQLSHSLGALALLADSGRGARLTDIAEKLEAPKSSVQRLLMQLADEGWVEQ